MFKGMSLLREQEKPVNVALTEEDIAKRAYLKRYTEGQTSEGQPKVKKRKKADKTKSEEQLKPKAKALPTVRIVDGDVSGFVSTERRAKEDEEEEGNMLSFLLQLRV